jgi:hypothetical protein
LISTRAKIICAAAVIGVLGCLVLGAGYAEYRTNFFAESLGSYLAGTNPGRPSAGRLWEIITSEEIARSTLPDSQLVERAPSDLPPLVRNHRLSFERIPQEGIPGYFAILVEIVPPEQQKEVDAGRLVDGTRLHRLGLATLSKAAFDPGPYLSDARKKATEMGSGFALPLTEVTVDTTLAPDSSQTEETLRALSPDSIAASVVETFTAVILEERLDELRNHIRSDWTQGLISQLFVNRALGVYQGELYYSDPSKPSVVFALTTEDVSAILGFSAEEAPR